MSADGHRKAGDVNDDWLASGVLVERADAFVFPAERDGIRAGRFLRETPPGNDVGYLAVSSTYRF
jgi:hypothetical protein